MNDHNDFLESLERLLAALRNYNEVYADVLKGAEELREKYIVQHMDAVEDDEFTNGEERV